MPAPEESSTESEAMPQAIDGDLENQVPKKWTYPYGIESDRELSNLELMLEAFRRNPPASVGGKGRPFYFWQIVEMLWGPDTDSPRKFLRNPWSELMIERACQYNYLGVHGCGSSFKTDTFAVYGIVHWLADPHNTLVLATSTSLKDSRKRIWGSITAYFQAAGKTASDKGKLIDSVGMIRTIAPDGTTTNDKCGIALIPGERKREKDAIGKIIGMKNFNVLMLADELPELSEALISAAQSNLSLNPHFQLIGLGNFKSIYDPLGVLVTPKDGWKSINVDHEEWETKDGWCIHLDGMKSPNVLEGYEVYPRMYGPKDLTFHQKKYGANSALFWRMCRSYPCPEGEENCIYSEADMILGESWGKADWMDIPIPVCTADPGFSTDGDEFAAAFGLFGRAANGLPTIQFTKFESIRDDVKLTQMGVGRDLQTAQKFAELATKHGVSRNHMGLDCSGPGGLAFGSIMSLYWTGGFIPISFAEVASDMLMSYDDPRKGCEAFVDLSSEMWFIGRSFVRTGQIKGLPSEVAAQMQARYYETVKQGDFIKVKIEPKRRTKNRIGQSPDKADAALMMIHLCRILFGFSPGGITVPGQNIKGRNPSQEWMKQVRRAHSVYNPQAMFSGS